MGQSNSSSLKVSECAMQAGKVAQHLALGEPVKDDLIFRCQNPDFLILYWVFAFLTNMVLLDE